MFPKSKLYRFARPSLLALVIGFTVMLACWVLQTVGSAAAPDDLPYSALAALELPRPELTPSEVIRMQVEALRDTESPGIGALQCYCFASPSNRLVTGPLKRFAQMVRAAPFNKIGQAVTYTIGAEEHIDDYVRSLVVTIDENQRPKVFAWVLQKQTDAPFEECWMTTGVFPMPAIEVPNPEEKNDGEWL